MQLPRLIPGRFVQRDNRFRATVIVDGLTTSAHVPTSGRMIELLLPDSAIWLAPQNRPGRKTPYDLVLVEHEGHFVSIDARLPNALFAEYLKREGWEGERLLHIRREVTLGDSRLDFLLHDARGPIWVEVKSVTLVVDGLALFPDAPTVRGARHVGELARVAAQGGRAAAVFVAQREDADRFAPHHAADPILAQALAQASAAGVVIRAYGCRVSREEIAIARRIPVTGIGHTPDM